jgi:hypothetical protein
MTVSSDDIMYYQMKDMKVVIIHLKELSQRATLCLLNTQHSSQMVSYFNKEQQV